SSRTPFSLACLPHFQASFGRHVAFSSILYPRPPGSTLFPYTTLFRSTVGDRQAAHQSLGEGHQRRHTEPGGAFRAEQTVLPGPGDRKSTRLNSSHVKISYAVFCLKKKKKMAIASRLYSNLNESTSEKL